MRQIELRNGDRIDIRKVAARQFNRRFWLKISLPEPIV